MLPELISEYGYLMIFLGGIMEGESVLLIGGLAAFKGYLFLPYIIIVAVVGAMLGDAAWFFLGRWKGERALVRCKFIERFARHPVRMIHAHPYLTAFSLRFMYGFRHVIPFSLGFSSISSFAFIILNFLGALTWASVIVFSGYLLADILEESLGSFRRMEFTIVVIVIVVISFVHALMWTIRRIITRKVEEE